MSSRKAKKMVCSYGLYAHTSREELEQARPQIEPSAAWRKARRRLDRSRQRRCSHQPRCPVCGLALVVERPTARTGRSPPMHAAEGVPA